MSASLISVYAIYLFKPDVTHIVPQSVGTTSGKKITVLSTESSIQSTTPGLVDLSLKGYLTTPNNIDIPNKNVQINLKGIQIDGNQTREENLVIGNSTTDQDGCFYFNNWNNEILNNTLMEIPRSYNMVNGLMNKTPQQTLHKANPNNLLWFATNFTGDNEFLPSSNITKIRFSPFMPIIERPAIGIHLTNNTSLVQDMYLKRGQSYNFEALVFRGNALSGPAYELLKLDIKGLPCGVASTFENTTANLTAQYNATTHLKISVNENARSGEYYYFIMGNNWILNEGKLIIE